MFFKTSCVIALACVAGAAMASNMVALATLVDGDTVLVRQTSRWALKSGARLQTRDVIETAPNTAITRIELTRGLVADLGPDTRIMLSPDPSAASKRQNAALYLRQGWVKISGASSQELGKTQILSEVIDVSGVSGSVVVSVQEKLSQIFVESGTVTVAEVKAGTPQAGVQLKEGSFLEKSGVEKRNTSARPTATFLAAVPKAFLDPIPLRAALFKDKTEPVLKVAGTLSYAQALPWLGGESMLREILLKQWQFELGADLRSGLAGNIKQHSEWRKVLFPDPPGVVTPAWPRVSP